MKKRKKWQIWKKDHSKKTSGCPENMTEANLSKEQIEELCEEVMEIFLEQPMLLKLESPIKIVGNIHGQYYDLLRIFQYSGFPPKANYLFLGSFSDFSN